MSDNCCVTCYDDSIQTFFIRAILWFSRIYNNVEHCCHSAYDNNGSCKLFYDVIIKNIHKLYLFFLSQRLEPTEVPWISTCWIKYNKERLANIYSYHEDFNHFFTNVMNSELFTEEDKIEYANKYFARICNTFYIDQFNPMVIMKTENQKGEQFYISRRGHVEISNLTLDKSAVHFLSIEYTHPDMNESIELQLDRSWFVVGNELFTSTFILRVLNYQSQLFVFDEKYKIKIMDENCNIVEFGEEKYMVITEDGYELKDANLMTTNPYEVMGHYKLSDIEHYSIFKEDGNLLQEDKE